MGFHLDTGHTQMRSNQSTRKRDNKPNPFSIIIIIWTIDHHHGKKQKRNVRRVMSLNTLIFGYFFTHTQNILSSYCLLCSVSIMTQLDGDPANKIIIIDGPDNYNDDIIIKMKGTVWNELTHHEKGKEKRDFRAIPESSRKKRSYVVLSSNLSKNHVLA